MPKDGPDLPARLKADVETLSGLSLDEARLHRNSGEPEPLQAAVEPREADVLLAPGQGPRLAHEAWHVVRQTKGRPASEEPASGRPVYDDGALEREAEQAGARAASSAAGRFVAFSAIDGNPWDVDASAAVLLRRVRSLSALGIGLTRCTEILECGVDAEEILGKGMPLDEARRRHRTVFRGDDCGAGLEPVDLTEP